MSPVGTRQRDAARHPVAAVAPDAVTGLQLWLKADALGLADAAAVSSWTDSSVNARHAVQATGSKQPAYKTSILNGKAVVRFGGDDILTCPAFGAALTAPYTVMTVCQMTLSGISSNRYVVASFDVADHGVIYGRSSDKRYACYSGTSLGGPKTDGFVVISATFNGASSVLQVGSAVAPGTAGSDSLLRVCVGSNRDVSSYLTGDVAEVIVYNSTPTVAELAGVRAHLGAKYDLSVF